jgi:hypothetical protein
MIQRNINPKPRFVTLTASVPSTGAFVGAPLATLFRASFFRFPQDSIIHYVSINSTFLANGAFSQVIGAIAYGQGQDNIGFNLGAGLDNTADEVIWRDELLNPVAGVVTADKSTQIMMNEYFVHTGTGIGIYVNGSNGNANINDTIAFNPIAEWVNFREPTTAARI